MKKVCLLILSIGMLFYLAACSGEKGNGKPGNDNLVMCTLDSGGFFKDTATRFNEKNRGKKIQVETFRAERFLEYADRQAAGLIAGKGPDIITFQYYEGGNSLHSFLKYIPKGVLLDLNELVEKDRDFRLEDYNKGALESGVFRGARYFIPLSFNVDVFFTTEEALKENHLSIDEEDWNWEALLKQVKDYRERGGGRNFFNWYNCIEGLVGNCGTSFLDAGSGLSSFASADFEELLDIGKRLMNSISTDPRDENTIMEFENIYGFRSLRYDISRSNGVLQAFPVPSGRGGTGGSAKPQLAVAISKNCRDKETAYKYIKYLLSEEAQSVISDLVLGGFPVSNKAYEQEKERVLKEEATFEEFRQLVRQVDKIASGAGRYEILDDAMFGIIKANAAGFFSGTQSAAEVGRLIDEGIEKYLGSVTAPAYAEKESNEESNAGGEIDKVLKIYYLEYPREDNIKHAVNKYKDIYEGVRLEETVFSISRMEDLKSRLVTDLLAGEGPDVILFNPYTFNSLHKVMDNGIFAELDQLVKADDEFNLSDYYEKVLDYGIYKGKRYFMPIDFIVPVLYTTDTALEKNNINIDESNWTWDELVKITREFMKRNEGKDKFMFSNLYFDPFLSLPVIDYENKQSNLNTPEFIKYAKDFNDLYKGIIPVEKLYSMKFDDLEYELLDGAACVMMFSERMGNLRNVCFPNSWANHYLKENIKIFPLPTINGDGKFYAHLNQCAAINNKCKYKEDAFNMIKMFLSVEHQACPSFSNNYMDPFNWPVNKKAFEQMKEYFRTSPDVNHVSVRRGKLVVHPVEEEVTAQLDRILENLETGCLVDYEIQKIVNEELALYYEDKKTIEKALRDAESKVELYLNE